MTRRCLGCGTERYWAPSRLPCDPAQYWCMPCRIGSRQPEQDRFWEKVLKTGGCWLWLAGVDGGGYAEFWSQGRHIKGHIFAYRLLIGVISAGKTLDHLCRVRSCVRPDHLEPVSLQENIGRRPWRSTCPNGHPLEEGTIYVCPKSKKRMCLECKRRSARDYLRRRRLEVVHGTT